MKCLWGISVILLLYRPLQSSAGVIRLTAPPVNENRQIQDEISNIEDFPMEILSEKSSVDVNETADDLNSTLLSLEPKLRRKRFVSWLIAPLRFILPATLESILYTVVGNTVQSHYEAWLETSDDNLASMAESFLAKQVCKNQMDHMVVLGGRFISKVQEDCEDFVDFDTDDCYYTRREKSYICSFHHTVTHTKILDMDGTPVHSPVIDGRCYPKLSFESRSRDNRPYDLVEWKQLPTKYQAMYKPRDGSYRNLYLDFPDYFIDESLSNERTFINRVKNSVNDAIYFFHDETPPLPDTLEKLESLSDGDKKNLYFERVALTVYVVNKGKADVHAIYESFFPSFWAKVYEKFQVNAPTYGAHDLGLTFLSMVTDGSDLEVVAKFIDAYDSNPAGDMRAAVAIVTSAAEHFSLRNLLENLSLFAFRWLY